MCVWMEGGEFHSWTARAIMEKCCGIVVGAYSYGAGCFRPGMFPRGTTIGRYCSLAEGVRIFDRNHPLDRLSTHPFFFNHKLGYIEQDTMDTGTLTIGHDAWVGERALITPGCRRIGIGAVVGAGAVVTKDVPDFAIVAGNPARPIRNRFSEDICGVVLASRWWELPLSDVLGHMAEMMEPLDGRWTRHPLLTRQRSGVQDSDVANG